MEKTKRLLLFVSANVQFSRLFNIVDLKPGQTSAVDLLDRSAERKLGASKGMFLPWTLSERDAGCPSGRLHLQTEIENLWYIDPVDLLWWRKAIE